MIEGCEHWKINLFSVHLYIIMWRHDFEFQIKGISFGSRPRGDKNVL